MFKGHFDKFEEKKTDCKCEFLFNYSAFLSFIKTHITTS